MNGTQRRQFEMLQRIRDFGHTHRDLFTRSIVAPQVFAAVGAMIDELTATDMKKLSASVSARADRVNGLTPSLVTETTTAFDVAANDQGVRCTAQGCRRENEAVLG